MQAIIMAAGKGSRLGSLTDGKPKSFAEIKGKKLIEYNLQLLNHYGVERITIVTGYCCDAFEEFTKDMKNVTLVYNPFYEMVNVLGSFFMGMEILNDDFIYLHADTICEPAIFEKMMKSNSDIILPIDYKKCDDEAMKVRSVNGKVVEITKQMSLDIAEGEFIGMAAFKKRVIPYLKNATKELMQEKEFMAYFESAIQRLIDKDLFHIEAVPTESYFWAEVDFLEDYERAVANIPESLINI